MVWRVYLGLTMQGALGPELDVSAGSITHTLNDHDALTVTFSRESIRGVPREWWSYRSGCLVATYTDASAVERIISACPVSSAPVEDHQAGTITLEGKGLGWILEDRVILDHDYDNTTLTDLRDGRVEAGEGRTWAAVIGAVLRTATELKRQAYLPLVRPAANTAGKHEYTWYNWDLANNGAWARIKEVLDADDGPDMAFRPEWVDDAHTHFRWNAIVGSDEQLTLPQDGELYLDATVPGTDVATIEVKSDPATMCHRVYATGAGEGKGIAMGLAEVAAIPDYMPIIERVYSDTGIERDAVDGTSQKLNAAAKAQLKSSSVEELSITINADPGRLPVGTWWCGETALVRTADWLTVPDGEYRLRLLSVAYTLGSDMVTMDCQESKLGEDFAW